MTIQHYELGMKIFIACVGVLIAYNYFYTPTLLLLTIGVPAYIYMKTYGSVEINKFTTDWTSIAETTNSEAQAPLELAAPAPAPAPVPVESKPTLQT